MDEYQKYVMLFLKGLMVLSIVLFLYFFLTKIVYYVLPFIIGWLLAWIINPFVNYFESKTKIPRGIISAFTLLLFFSTVSLLIFLGISRLVTELNNMSEHLPQYMALVEGAIRDLITKGQNLYFNLPSHYTFIIQENINNLVKNLTNALSFAITRLATYLTFLPRTLIFLIVVIISAFLISKDMKFIARFFSAQIPKNYASRLKSVETDLLKALGGFIRAQLTIMGITFAITATGLYIIKIPYALTMALIIGLVDALPILGTGAVLIPWAIINFIIVHNYSRGIALLILYGIIIISRQMLEPKIVGKNIGLHPLVALAAIYIGFQAFGIIGILLGPLTVIVLKAMQKSGLIPPWKAAGQP